MSVTRSITPLADATYSIGTALLRYLDFFLSGSAAIGGNLTVEGTTSVKGLGVDGALICTGDISAANISTAGSLSGASISGDDITVANGVNAGGYSQFGGGVAFTGGTLEAATDLIVGTVTLSGGTADIPLTSINAFSKVFLSYNNTLGTPGILESVLDPGVGFTINSSEGSDGADVNWWVITAI